MDQTNLTVSFPFATETFRIPTVSYPGQHIVGTCGACGGPMLVPEMWGGSPEVYPKPGCANCGKQKKHVARWGPVIEVE